MTCTGKERSCENFNIRAAGNSQFGCRFTATNALCVGSPQSCSDFSSKSSCDQQSGCSWDSLSSSTGIFWGILLGSIVSAIVLLGLAVYVLLYYKGYFQTKIPVLEKMRKPAPASKSFENEIVDGISVHDADDNVKHLTEITPHAHDSSKLIKVIERIDPDGSQTTETHRETSNGEIVIEIVSGKIE